MKHHKDCDLNKEIPNMIIKCTCSAYEAEKIFGICENPTAKRDPIRFRFDILDPEFLQALAAIADYGAKKYGERNWKKSRMIDDRSPVNHIARHLLLYEQNVPYDHKEVLDSHERKLHLAAIAFNAMMEFWYESHPECK